MGARPSAPAEYWCWMTAGTMGNPARGTVRRRGALRPPPTPRWAAAVAGWTVAQRLWPAPYWASGRRSESRKVTKGFGGGGGRAVAVEPWPGGRGRGGHGKHLHRIVGPALLLRGRGTPVWRAPATDQSILPHHPLPSLWPWGLLVLVKSSNCQWRVSDSHGPGAVGVGVGATYGTSVPSQGGIGVGGLPSP